MLVKLKWMLGLVVCSVLLLNGCGDNTTPPESILKKNFEQQFRGQIKLDSITLTETSVEGNQRTYAVDGKLSSDFDLYTIIATLGDYTLVEKSWDKGKGVKFTATLESVGSKDSGWDMRFSALKMLSNPQGREIPDINTNEHYLVLGSSGFKDKLNKIDSFYKSQAKEIDALTKKVTKIESDILSVSDKIRTYWGVEENGRELTRTIFYNNLNKELRNFEKNNNPYQFEQKYHYEVFEPARKAREQKLKSYSQSDFDDLRAKRDEIVSKQKEEYNSKHKEIELKIESEMKKLDDGLALLKAQKQDLDKEREKLSSILNNIKYKYNSWVQEMERLRLKGTIK